MAAYPPAGPPGPTPRDRWYRRYWGYYNRPYGGCGCAYTFLVFLLFWWLLSLIFPPLAFWTAGLVWLAPLF